MRAASRLPNGAPTGRRHAPRDTSTRSRSRVAQRPGEALMRRFPARRPLSRPLGEQERSRPRDDVIAAGQVGLRSLGLDVGLVEILWGGIGKNDRRERHWKRRTQKLLDGVAEKWRVASAPKPSPDNQQIDAVALNIVK